MTESTAGQADQGPEEPTASADDLARFGGVGIGVGEPSTFEPEEDPESVEPPG